MPQFTTNRRRFLAGGAGLALGGLITTACGSSDDNSGAPPSDASTPAAHDATGTTTTSVASTPSGSASGGSSGSAPTYVPYTAVKPDLPALEHGTPAAFYHYPANPPSFINHPLGNGDDITFMLQANAASPVDRNKWWQAMNAGVKANLKLNGVPSSDYLQKFQVTTAGGDIPDVVQVVNISHLPEVLDKEFTDLTEFLSGDNIKEYPGLASIPTSTWTEISTLNGKIWGVAQPRPAAGSVISTRGDVLKSFGVSSNSPVVSSGDEFMALCKQLTDAKHNKYAFGENPNNWLVTMMLEMVGAPNNWALEGGKLVSVNETDQMKDAITNVTKLWKAGYVHPDAFTASNAQAFTWWQGGIFSLYFQSIAGWASYAIPNPTWDIGVLATPKWEGGGLAPKQLSVPGYAAYAAIKKAKPDRVKEILRVMDYFAAPFGTKEYLTMNYGVEGVHYKLKGSDPMPITAATNSDAQKAWVYCGGQPNINIYFPGSTDLAKAEYNYLKTVMPTGVADPTTGLYSETNVTAGATAGKALTDVRSDILQDRKKLSDWDGAVSAWRKAAGDKIRSEYEAALAAKGGN